MKNLFKTVFQFGIRNAKTIALTFGGATAVASTAVLVYNHYRPLNKTKQVYGPQLAD